MSIELLWILPVVAFALTLPVIVMAFHQTGQKSATRRSHTRELTEEVNTFNQGLHLDSRPVEQRIGEIDKIINLVTGTLSTQQKIIETFRGKDDSVSGELSTLKTKLHELQREYDIVISENYSLRAQINKLVSQSDACEPFASSPPFTAPVQAAVTVQPVQTQHPVDFLKLYGDTRTFKASDLDDTREINLADLR